MNVISTIVSILLAVSGLLAFTGHRYIQSRVIAPGKVTQLIANRGQKGTTYKIVASFSDRNGHTHVYNASFSSSSPGYKRGDPIRICYKESDPADCGIYSFGYRFGVAWVLASLALTLAVTTLGFRHGQRVMDGVYLDRTSTIELR